VGAGASTGAVAGGGGGESETWGGCARATVGGDAWRGKGGRARG
jgi:hypothetical protein